jgi:hypothetical protein
MEQLNLLGAGVALAIFVLSSLTFISRLAGHPELGRWLGVPLLLTVFPLGYLLSQAPQHARPPLYYLQIGLMLAWLAVAFVLDYWPRIEFRQVRWAVIGFVVLFFAGTGGMIGVAALAGRPWTMAAGILFLIMAVLAFVQRAATGW